MARSQGPAEAYEAYFVPAMFGPWAAELLKFARLEPGERVIDVACGTGVVARAAAALVTVTGSVVAVDGNPAMLEIARGAPAVSGAAVEWIQGDALSLPVAAASADVTLCQHAITFMPDRAAAVSQMRRALAPGGRSLTMALQGLELHPVFSALMHSVARHLGVPLAHVDVPFALGDADEFVRLHLAAGFEHTEVVEASIMATFENPERFVPMSVASSAAAVPGFVGLDDPSRAALVASIARDCVDAIEDHTRKGAVTFPMYSYVAIARG